MSKFINQLKYKINYRYKLYDKLIKEPVNKRLPIIKIDKDALDFILSPVEEV
jgi:hypothetical protein